MICAHCGSEVRDSEAICTNCGNPATQTYSNSEATQDSEMIDKLVRGIVWNFECGIRSESTCEDLVKEGFSEPVAREMVEGVRKAIGAKHIKGIAIGILLMIVGAVISIWSYSSASESGGTYYVFYGLIVVGAIWFFPAMYKWVRIRML